MDAAKAAQLVVDWDRGDQRGVAAAIVRLVSEKSKRGLTRTTNEDSMPNDVKSSDD